jgi:lipoyl(octanoyl) transferase
MSLAPAISRTCAVRMPGCMPYGAAFEWQRELVAQRKAGLIEDQLLLLEHSHVVTIGRNGHAENLLLTPEAMAARGIEFHETDRGGDVTYHGPGQIIGYPILDLNDWQRDVHKYVRAIEEVLIRVLADFEIEATRIAGFTGVWTAAEPARKIAAIGVHISRWVTSHGFALNVDPDLSYFGHIVPCGLTRPVTSMRELGCQATWRDVAAAVQHHFLEVFDFDTTRQAHHAVTASHGEFA